jgi:glyoxylase-like metal-dependent hydrolase (beta-lactamase superfamily II)
MSSECASGSVTPSLDNVFRIEFDVDWPPGHAVAWLVDGPEPVLVDAGPPGEDAAETLTDALATRGYEFADVDHVVVTHPHSDHVGQIPRLLEAGARLYAPGPALDQLRRDPDDLEVAVRETAREAGLDEERADRAVEQAVDSLERDWRLLPPDEVDIEFGFGEDFSVGEYTFTPHHTPGHQQTHASFTVDLDGTALFSGDALIEPFRAAAIHAGIDHGAYEAIDAFYTAMDRFEAIEADRAFPGHGPAFDDIQGAVDSTRESLDGLVEGTAEALAAVEPATPLEVSYERAGPAEHPATLLDTLGALGYLETAGRADCYLADGVRQYETA